MYSRPLVACLVTGQHTTSLGLCTPCVIPRRHTKPHSGLAGSAWRQRQPPQLVQPSSPPSNQHPIHREQLPLHGQQFRAPAGLVSTASAASTQQARPPPPGFEASTAGSQWLEAVQLAGLAEPLVHNQPTMDEQPSHQTWVDTQPVATVQFFCASCRVCVGFVCIHLVLCA